MKENVIGVELGSRPLIQAAKTRQPFEVELQRQRDAGCITLSGDFEPGCVGRFEDRLAEAEREHVRFLILDLRGLYSVQAAEIAELLSGRANERRNGVALILVRVPKRLRVAVEETGLDRVLPVAYDAGRFEHEA